MFRERRIEGASHHPTPAVSGRTRTSGTRVTLGLVLEVNWIPADEVRDLWEANAAAPDATGALRSRSEPLLHTLLRTTAILLLGLDLTRLRLRPTRQGCCMTIDNLLRRRGGRLDHLCDVRSLAPSLVAGRLPAVYTDASVGEIGLPRGTGTRSSLSDRRFRYRRKSSLRWHTSRRTPLRNSWRFFSASKHRPTSAGARCGFSRGHRMLQRGHSWVVASTWWSGRLRSAARIPRTSTR